MIAIILITTNIMHSKLAALMLDDYCPYDKVFYLIIWIGSICLWLEDQQMATLPSTPVLCHRSLFPAQTTNNTI